jgi:hypothetical protein
MCQRRAIKAYSHQETIEEVDTGVLSFYQRLENATIVVLDSLKTHVTVITELFVL